jgi:hypothetical protein
MFDAHRILRGIALVIAIVVLGSRSYGQNCSFQSCCNFGIAFRYVDPTGAYISVQVPTVDPPITITPYSTNPTTGVVAPLPCCCIGNECTILTNLTRLQVGLMVNIGTSRKICTLTGGCIQTSAQKVIFGAVTDTLVINRYQCFNPS